MKKPSGIVGVLVLLASSNLSFAIEGLQISVHCPDVFLSWPSTNGETYIVQYRQTLDAGSSWLTLTDNFPAAIGTNITVFVHSNMVQCPSGQSIGGGSYATSMGSGAGHALMAVAAPQPNVPLAMPADGSASPVPLCLYPPGFDLSNFLIFDPASSAWVHSSVFSMGTLTSSGGFDVPQPDGSGSSGDSGGLSVITGFYRVVRDGAHLWGITNGMTLSGVVTIPMEVGSATGSLAALSVREDGAPVGNSQSIAPFQFPLGVTLDTTAMSNGIHQISGFASWNSSGDEFSGDGTDAESPPVTVNIYNEISFPNWLPLFGELYNSLLITVQSEHTDADWYIDVYGSESGYIGTFAGHTYDGNIYGAWNLIGPHGESHANEQFFQFVVESDWSGPGNSGGGSAVAISPKTYKQKDNWTTHGMWVVANQQAFEDLLGHDELDTASDGFAEVAEIAGLTVRPSRPSGESFRIGYGSEIPESTRNAQWSSVRAAIYHQESRNMFYLGHGSPTGIGAVADTNRFIPADEIASGLHTLPAGQTNRHGYRFVFLYGCETASGTLPESFGILHREKVDPIDYVNAALTPGAFVGWDIKADAAVLGTTLDDNAQYLQHFLYEWATNGLGVKQALNNAKDHYTYGILFHPNKLKCFGNWDLTYYGFNR